MKSERELFELEARKYEDCDLSKNEDGSYKSDLTHTCFYWWCKSAQREGYKLVPVETLEECLSWAACASSESWSDEQRDEIDKHYKVIEKAMIGAAP